MSKRLAFALLSVAVLGVPVHGQQTREAGEADRPAPVSPDRPEPGPATAEAEDDYSEYLLGDWGGIRRQMADRGVAFELRGIGDWSYNFDGGWSDKRGAFRYLLDATVTLDTERLFKWPGGTIFFDFQHHDGKPGYELTGDWQWPSWIDAPPRTQIAELWYQQMLLNDKVRIKAGKVDAITEFGFAENADGFLHAGIGYLLQPLVPSYPDPATSVNLFVYPTDWFYAGAGVYDGAIQEGYRTGLRGPRTFFGSPADWFFIGEAGLKWNAMGGMGPGRLAAGGWHHTGTFERFEGGEQDGTSQPFVIFEQMLWRENPQDKEDEQGIRFFAMWDWSDPEVLEIDHHVAGGITWKGFLPGRDEDMIGLGASWVRFSDEPGAGFTEDGELAMETFYRMQLLPSVALTFDFEYIMDPGGDGLDDVLLGTMRVEVSF